MAPEKNDKRAKDEPEFLYVRSNLNGDAVALHEIDPAHPGGSVMVAGNLPAKVAPTSFVRERLRDHWLVEVDDADDRKRADEIAASRLGTEEAPKGDLDQLGAGEVDKRDWPGSKPTPAEVASGSKADAKDAKPMPRGQATPLAPADEVRG